MGISRLYVRGTVKENLNCLQNAPYKLCLMASGQGGHHLQRDSEKMANRTSAIKTSMSTVNIRIKSFYNQIPFETIHEQ